MCLGLSSIYHLYNYYSRHICYKLATFDYGGICMLIAGSAYPPIYYSFACKPLFKLRNLFLAVLTIGACLVFAALCNEKLASNEWRRFKVGMFIALGAAGVTPFIYVLNFEDKYSSSMNIDLSPYYLGGVFYLIGAILFATRIPERFGPGKFDNFGNAHNIFHVFVVVAAIIHYNAGLKLFEQRQDVVCPL